MKDTIFRAKTKTTKEWVEGDLTRTTYYEPNGEKKVNYKISVFDISLDDEGDPVSLSGLEEDVIPETIGQSINIPDANGKQIFDDDIVKFGDMVGIINYSTGCYCVRTNKPDWKSRNNPAIDIILNEYPNEIEVIGNIHDNPELLK